MALTKWGRKKAEMTKPQESEPEKGTGSNNAVSPSDIDNMSDEEFDRYLEELSDETQFVSEDEAEGDTNLTDNDDEADNKKDDGGEKEKDDGTNADVNGEPGNDAPFKVFATESDYEAEVKKRIDEAVKKIDNPNSKEKSSIDKICKIAKKFYKDSENPLEEVASELEKQYAENSGVEIDDLRKSMSDEEDAEKYRKQKKDKEDFERGRDEVISKWNSEAEQITKFIDSDFDFKTALKDEKFKDAILSGKSVLEAYSLIKKPENKKAEREPIEQNARNSRKGTGGGKPNPAKLSDVDFKKYIENIKNS